MKRTITPLLCAALAALCSACAKPPPPPEQAPTVLVAPPLAREVTDWDDYSGRFEAMEWVEIRPRVSGAIESIHFEDGQTLQKGQLLFVIDARPYQAQVARARAQIAGAKAALANADAELKRAQALVETRLISQSQSELRVASQLQASADLEAAEAALSASALDLSFTRITAPIAGKASYRRLAPGNLVTADTTVLTTVVNTNPIRFVFDAPESALLRYKRDAQSASSGAKDSRVEIRLQDEKEYRWKGHIDFVDNAMDQRSGTIRGRAVLDNPDGFISPGMFGQIRLLGAKPYTALMVPDQAVVTDQTRQVVYVVNADSTVALKVVQPGKLIDGLRVIHSGIDANDRVIISGVQRARPGRKVTAQAGEVSAFPTGVSRGENSTLSLPAAAAPGPRPRS